MTSLSIIFYSALLSASSLAHASTVTRPLPNDQETREILRSMHNASTWGHPDQFGQFSGVQLYAKGRYAAAMKYFKSGAFYADKFSQLSIGLMYLNGQGVAKDPVLAYAWVSVAAERKYPQFMATRDRLWSQLTLAQQHDAEAAKAEVAEQYGDAVAKPRMIHELQYWKTQITGSRTGQSNGVFHMDLSMIDPGVPISSCSARAIEGAPISGCGGNVYDKSRWNPDQYFQWVDSQWTGTVTVGALQTVKGAATNGTPTQAEPKPAADH